MASNNGNGRGRGPGRRRHKGNRHNPFLHLESLEGRTLLDGGGGVARPWLTNPTNIYDTQHGPMANAGGQLIKIYADFQAYKSSRINIDPVTDTGFQSSPQNTSGDSFRIVGNRVGIDVRGIGDLRQLQGDLSVAGMKIEASDSTFNIVEGLVPIDMLPAIAAIPNVIDLAPITKMMVDQQGLANNQAEQALMVDTARAQFGVTGAGVKIGVLSDSINQAPNPFGPANRPAGLAGSIATGDLPSNVTVLQDGPAGSSDEGRAMLEQIYDLAPGAQLYFATAAGGPVNFANNIRALAAAGCTVIVDDIFYGGIPFFQDGIIAQAVKDVVKNFDVVYVSSAGNAGDHGYESPVFSVNTTTVGGVNGRYVDFDPSAATLNQMPITVTGATAIEFQFDQPFSSVSTATPVTSNVDIKFYDANNNLITQGGTNTTATQLPLQQVAVPANATSFSVQILSGPDIGRFRIREFGTQSDFNVSKQFGTTGGITYPTSFGHKVVPEMIGTGAVPWFGTPPVANPSPVVSESFSSFGPVNILFDSSGNALSTPEKRYKPDVSATDGNNTSFFGQLPGVPAGFPTNDYTLPNFFGTSSAAPNLAAIAALMRQLTPFSTSAEIRGGLITSALSTPLNPAINYASKVQVPGVGLWDPQGGYGLVDAVKALNAVNLFRVNSVTPGNGQTVNSLPSTLVVTFNNAVNPATLSPSNLTITGPAGVTITVGTPTVDPNNPNAVLYPISVNAAPGVIANGTYTISLAAGAVAGINGKPLQPFTTTFKVADAIAPKVTGTTFNGRFVTIQFSEAMRASTITSTNVVLAAPNQPSLNADPRYVVTYDPINNRAIIDLSALPQSLLISGDYKLTISDLVTDAVGNKLDGEFNPTKTVFPSGDGTAGGSFLQNLLNVVLQAPIFVSLTIDPASDSGVTGDAVTRITTPKFNGQLTGTFPASIAGVQVAIQFSGLHGGALDLAVGFGGRGFSGTPDLIVTTDAQGRFSFTAPAGLIDGFQKLRAVVVGDADQPPLPGLARLFETSFRIDTTNPIVTAITPTSGTAINTLTSITLNVADPLSPTTGPLALPISFNPTALDPASVSNVSNYRLINLGADNQIGGGDDVDFSSFIVSATYVAGANRVAVADPLRGQVKLTIASGLPAGHYQFQALTAGVNVPGLVDIAGNPLDGDPNTPGLQNFVATYDIQPTPTYITSVVTVSPDPSQPSGTSENFRVGQYFEVQVPGNTGRAAAPPSEFHIDFSNPLPDRDYSSAVALLRSANPGTNVSDGDFGLIDGPNTSNSTVPNVTVRLFDTTTGLFQGQPGFVSGNRLVVTIPTTLAPDSYRLYIANSGANVITDIYGNQLDGEFTGNLNPDGSGYETLLQNGQIRAGYSGDGAAGGAFEVGYLVVPNGNVIFARADALDDPNVTGGVPDGSPDHPYAALAPEGDPRYVFANDPGNAFSGQSNLNSLDNYGSGFNATLDRNGDGRFQQSAFFAAQVRSQFGPVVIIAEASLVDPSRTFVLAPGQGTSGSQRDGSASVPYNTTLVLDSGSILKMNNASLFVQNQGAALQIRGGANFGQQAVVTSYFDDSAGGDTNRDGSASTPAGGDYGGIVFRNFDTTSTPGSDRSRITFPVDTQLKGQLNSASGQFSPAVTGADEALSIIDHAAFRFGGGAVPQSLSPRYNTIDLFNTRIQISNTAIANSGSSTTATAQAGIAGDFDSFREDDLYRGPLIRRTTITGTSISGVLIRANPNTGVAGQTDAQRFPSDPDGIGVDRSFSLFGTLPYVLASQLAIGRQTSVVDGTNTFVTNRLYIDAGTLMKFAQGAGIGVVNRNASLVVGDRTYIRQFDANNNLSPSDADFRYNPNAARVVFTTLYDDNASTSFTDPRTGVTTTIAPAGDTNNDGSGTVPTTGQIDLARRWGGIEIVAGARAIIDQADFRFGGGANNGPEFTTPAQSVVAFTNDLTTATYAGFSQGGNITTVNGVPALVDAGANVMITNNNFTDNFDAAMQIDPNGLLVGDTLRPLVSGHPFFRGNVMQNNDIDGLAVVSNRGYTVDQNTRALLRQTDIAFPTPDVGSSGNQTVSTLWDSTDLTYVVRGSIVIDGYTYQGFGAFSDAPPLPTAALGNELQPKNVLTVQSALPGTLMPNGDRIASPGESAIIKLQNDYAPAGAGTLTTFGSTTDNQVGAGFVVGVDDGIDPPTPDRLVDPGAGSQLRFVGIGANETTGQRRVPVILTSLRDGTVGNRVRGVDMFNIYNNDPINPTRALTTPQAGDGGYIYFGGNSLFDYNLLDPRGGNIIDNADIRYMTRVEIQAGGIVDAADTNADGSITVADNWRNQKLGVFPNANGAFLTQNNSAQAMTISNSNFRFMADAAVFAHPDSANALVRIVSQLGAGGPITGGGVVRSAARGQGMDLFLTNNTFSDSPVGVRITSETGNGLGNGDLGQSPEQIVLLNNTFNNLGIAFDSEAPQFNGQNDLAHVYWLAMNNIFANSTQFAIRSIGQMWSSSAQYNVFSGNATDLQINGQGFLGNSGPIFGAVSFVDAANGNFALRPGSAGIDAARSEIGPLVIGNALLPISTQALDATLGVRNTIGRRNPFGGDSNYLPISQDLVNPPGSMTRLFADQFQPVYQGTVSGAIAGPFSAQTGYYYLPINGVRDQAGYLRQDATNVPNVGFGSQPFYDMGAYEYRQLNPPQVTGVNATLPTTTRSIYSVGGIGGVNQTPQTISVTFNRPIEAASLNNLSVLLVSAGTDKLLNTPDDQKINLAGKIAYNATTFTLTINLGAAGLTLNNDLYLLRLLGNGASVIRDTSGNTLDGENLDANGVQRALPSGDGFPGGDFQVTFTVNTSSPNVVAGSLALDPATDSNVTTDLITNDNTPTFTGTVNDVFPPNNPLINQTAIIDISSKGDGVFDILGAGTALTDAQGRFSVTLTTPVPDSPRNVGPDGILGTADDLGFTLARVRLINTSGNTSDPNDPNARLKFWVDTTSPAITSASPASGSLVQATAGASGRIIPVSLDFNENIFPSSIASGVRVVRSGGDGIFGNGNDVTLGIDPASIAVTNLFTTGGAQRVTFNVIDTTGGNLPNDLYQITFAGTGANRIIDTAGNGLASDLVSTITVFDPTQSHIIFVDGGSTSAAPDGTRANPYRTITAGLNAAGIGDTVAVLPPSGSLAGPPPADYNESITLKSEVRLVSADPTSTDTNLVRGNALNTVIRAPDGSAPVTVTGSNLISVPGLDTEISGFTIAGPLIGNQATGPINTNSIGLFLTNSDVLVNNNYFITAGYGIVAQASGVGAAGARLYNNVIVGNINGVVVQDNGVVSYRTGQPARLYNNTIGFNTYGAVVAVNAASQPVADIANNIFWMNNDRTFSRNGAAVLATAPGQTLLRANLFFDNGPSTASNADDVIGVGGVFDPNGLNPVPDNLGNFVGNPSFVNPRDPRPNFDGPGFFYVDGNFDLKADSAAIDNALNIIAPLTDFLGRSRVKVSSTSLLGRGPADLGAFEFGGLGGTAIGGQFRIVGSSLARDGSTRAQGVSLGTVTNGSPNQIVVTFSRDVDRASVLASDLLLSGPGIDPANPARAVSVTWINSHTAIFTITGSFTPGVVQVAIAPGVIRDQYGVGIAGFNDSFKLDPNPVVTPTPTQTPVAVGGGAVAAPTPGKNKNKNGKNAKKPVKKVVAKPKKNAHKKAPAVHKPGSAARNLSKTTKKNAHTVVVHKPSNTPKPHKMPAGPLALVNGKPKHKV